jgi:hypothetical protein
MASQELSLFVQVQVFFGELLGRYACLQQFVEGIRLHSGSKSPQLFNIYSDQIWDRVINIAFFARRVARARSESVNEDSLLLAFRYLESQSEEFQKLHRTLRWFSAPWPEAEMIQFLTRIVREEGLAQLEADVTVLAPSIVFTDEYNFFAYDVGYVQKDIPRSTLKAWALPKSESSNPLLWPVLAHEVAHSLFTQRNAQDEVDPKVAEDPIEDGVFARAAKVAETCPESSALIQRWAVELNADLFAFNLFGPAYLYSLMYFSMFFTSGDLHQPLTTNRDDRRSLHPPPRVRVDLLLREARSSINRGAQTQACEHTLSVFEKLFSSRLLFNNLTYPAESMDYEDLLLSEPTIEKLWQALRAFQEKYFSSEAQHLDFGAISRLSDRLSGGVLAGSVQRVDFDLVLKYLRNDGVSREGALAQLDERPAKMIDIINAAWMQKFPTDSGRLTKSKVVSELEPMEDISRDTVFPLMERLLEPARQLQTSIQSALIISSLVNLEGDNAT